MLIRAMIFLLGIITMQSCGSQGWIVAGVPLTPQDTVTNTVFTEIIDADSVVHWFHGSIGDYSTWCYKHERWDEVEVK